MKKLLALLTAFLLLSGCDGTKDTQDKLLTLRQNLSRSGYSFLSHIHADFGENTYDFSMQCQFDADGNMTFQVIDPETIRGITGNISAGKGELTFDEKAVAFYLLADGRISPVSGPWLGMRGLKSGYLSSWQEDGGNVILNVDDSFEGDTVSFRISLSKDGIPVSGQIIWEERCIVSFTVENFQYL